MQRPRTSVPTPQRQLRGLRSENNEVILHPGSARPATPGKNVLARPPSSLAAFSHVTRLGTRGGGSFGPAGGGERPITQYGVAGMRPGTGRGMMRQIQDKRYYLSLLQLKIRDLTQEIATILRDIEAQTKEKAKFHHFDKLAKDFAAQLTNLQSELADYNTVVDKLTSDVSKREIEEETFELAARNQENQSKIEELLDRRFQIQESSRQIVQTIESRNRSGAILLSKMAAADGAKFESLQAKKNNLNLSLNDLQGKLEELSLAEEKLVKEMGNSQLKMEMVKLQLKLTELEQKKKKLMKEEGTEISPEEEKEKILSKVRMENVQISAAEAQLGEVNKKIQDGERMLERLQIETEENESEKQLKFKELKKREMVIEEFMSNFEFNKESEKQKLERLQKLVFENLVKISKNPILANFDAEFEELANFEVDEDFVLRSDENFVNFANLANFGNNFGNFGNNFGNFGNIGNNFGNFGNNFGNIGNNSGNNRNNIENIGNNRNNIENSQINRNNIENIGNNIENRTQNLRNTQNSQNTQNNTGINRNNTENAQNSQINRNNIENIGNNRNNIENIGNNIENRNQNFRNTQNSQNTQNNTGINRNNTENAQNSQINRNNIENIGNNRNNIENRSENSQNFKNGQNTQNNIGIDRNNTENPQNTQNNRNNIETPQNNRNNIENRIENSQNFEINQNSQNNTQNSQNNTQNSQNNAQHTQNTQNVHQSFESFENFASQLEKLQKLTNFKIQFEILQNRLENELKSFNNSNLINLSNSADFEANLSEKIAKLNLQNEELKNSEKIIESELNNVKIEFENRNKIASNDELINEINKLQILEGNLKVERRKVEASIEREKKGGNFEMVKRNTVKLAAVYNKSIKDTLKNVFAN